MTKDERIASLEARLAAAEARLATLETRPVVLPTPVVPYYPRQYVYPYLWWQQGQTTNGVIYGMNDCSTISTTIVSN